MTWRIDNKRGVVEYFVDNDVLYFYPLPRTGPEVVSLLSKVMDTSVTRDEIRVLVVLLSASVR